MTPFFLLASQEYERDNGEPGEAYGSDDDEILLLASQQYESKENINGETCDERELSLECDDEILLLASEQYESNDKTCAQYNRELLYDCDGYDEVLFLESSDKVDKNKMLGEADPCKHDESIVAERFASPVSEDDILKLIDGSIPANTKKTTLWAVNTWKEWVKQRKEHGNEIPPSLDEATDEDMNKWLAQFILEVRNKHGECYTGATIYSLCAGIQRYI